jgi:hypothetical protein
LSVTGNRPKPGTPIVEPHDVEAGRALVELELGIFGAKGLAIRRGKDHLAKGSKIFDGDGLRLEGLAGEGMGHGRNLIETEYRVNNRRGRLFDYSRY